MCVPISTITLSRLSDICIYHLRSNGVLTDSVTEGAGNPFGPVVNPKGGGIRNPREASVSLTYY